MHSTNDTDRLPQRPSYETWRPATTSQVSAGSNAPTRPWKRHRGLWPELWRWLIVLAIWIPVVVGLLGGSLLAMIYRQARIDQTGPADAIVVLGTAQYDGRPGPVLQARLDEVVAAYEAGAAPLIVVTGGRQAGDRFTEAEASRDYLVSQGVPERAIRLENEGRSSWQSMQGAAAILDPLGVKRILFVSDGFHLFRLKVMAHKLGFTALGDPASSSPIKRNSSLEFDYVVREAGGVIDFIWHYGF